MTSRVLSFLALLCLLPLLGCVGPTTPLGAVDESLSGPHQHVAAGPEPPQESKEDVAATIEFSPAFQQVHGPYDWHIIVRDPASPCGPEPSDLRVFYNRLEVSEAARFQFEKISRDVAGPQEQVLRVLLPNLRLGVLEEHAISVEYSSWSGQTVTAEYEFPTLEEWEAQEPIAQDGPFRISPEVREAIYCAAQHYRVNPALLGGLIAQESSFNPLALSRANALGLTQITHLTEPDIVRQFEGWPRYPGIQKLPRKKLRRLIPGKINRENEWRLDVEKSIWGGAYYLAYLRKRLLHESNRKIVRRGGEDTEHLVTEAALAAYNSGLNRTLYIIKISGENWLEHRKLREAKRYVRKVMSYYGMFREEEQRGGTG